MNSIPPEPRQGNSGTEVLVDRFKIEGVDTVIDTIELFAQVFQEGFRTKIEKIHGKRIKIEDCSDADDGTVWGSRVCINSPIKKRLVRYLAEEQARLSHGPKRFHLLVHKVHVAASYITVAQQDADELQDHLERQIRLKWQRHPGIVKYSTSAYWNKRPANRNIAAYANKHDKNYSYCKLELRLNRTAIRQKKLTNVADILDINPHLLFTETLRWVDENREEQLIKKRIRRLCRQQPQLMRDNKHNIYSTSSYLARRYRGFIRHVGYTASRNDPDNQGVLDLVPDSCSYPDN